jgi:MoaA/NifB/PqqE/SkfB family radical SAM enzyme
VSIVSKSTPVEAIDSSITKRYVLNRDVKYRRERFGGVAVNVGSQAARFYNTSAARILELCIQSLTEQEILARLGKVSVHDDEVSAFLRALTQQGILEETSALGKSSARTFFTDVTDFPSEALFSPLAVEIETTLKCRRACTYCSYESGVSIDTTDELTTFQWLETLQKLDVAGVFYLRFTGGDPLVRQDFPRVLEAADQIGLILAVSSDLTGLTESQAQVLSKTRNLYAVQTTLDGAEQNTADRFRGHGNYSSVTRGLKLLRSYGVPVSVGTVVTRSNFQEIGKIGRRVRDLGVLRYGISPLYPVGRGREMLAQVPTNEEMGVAMRQFRELVRAGIVEPADPAWLSIADSLPDEEFDHLVDDQPFLARQPDRILRIGSAGDCYTSVKLKEVLHENMFVGNIIKQDIQELWRGSPLLRQLRALSREPSYFGNVVDVRSIAPALTTVRQPEVAHFRVESEALNG